MSAGALVRAVPPDTPAARAGLRSGDVIVAIDGEEIATVEDLYAAPRKHEPGKSVTVTVVRDGKRQEFDVCLGRLPS